MLQQTIQLFGEKEEEFVHLLVSIGTRKNVAKVLVYLANIKEATSRQIERGTDLRQPEVSLAAKFLEGKGWIRHRQVPPARHGRPVHVFTLARPVKEIMAVIGKEKMDETRRELELVKKMKSFV